jgi:hypothetical protein
VAERHVSPPSAPILFNGTNYDRPRGGTGGSLGYEIATLDMTGLAADANAVSPSLVRDSAGSARLLGTGPLVFNGTTFDRQRNNLEGTALTSAARTAATNSADITNYNGRGILVTLDISAASGTGGLQIRIAVKDPVSGNYANLNALPTAVITISTTTYLLYPGATTGATQTTNGALPRTFRISTAVGDASSYTYSVGYTIIL